MDQKEQKTEENRINLLANKELVPELIQDQAQPELIGQKVLDRLNTHEGVQTKDSFTDLHLQLKLNASEQAAKHGSFYIFSFGCQGYSQA